MTKLALWLLGIAAFSAHAEIYKSVDEKGHITYSNIPAKGAKKLNLESHETPRPKASHSNPDMRIDRGTQRGRDETRYKILSEELSAEQNRLNDARQALFQASKEEQKSRREDVFLHEKNIEALKREISNLK